MYVWDWMETGVKKILYKFFAEGVVYFKTIRTFVTGFKEGMSFERKGSS